MSKAVGPRVSLSGSRAAIDADAVDATVVVVVGARVVVVVGARVVVVVGAGVVVVVVSRVAMVVVPAASVVVVRPWSRVVVVAVVVERRARRAWTACAGRSAHKIFDSE